MTSKEFVEMIRQVVLDAAVVATEKNLLSPPGRSSLALKQLSTWYKELSAIDQSMVAKCMQRAAHSAVFGFFAVLDGVRVIEDTEEKGDLVLEYRREWQQNRFDRRIAP